MHQRNCDAAREAEEAADELEDFPYLEGFLRFFRLKRAQLIEQAALHLLSPNRARLARAAAETWSLLSEERKKQYQQEAQEEVQSTGVHEDEDAREMPEDPRQPKPELPKDEADCPSEPVGKAGTGATPKAGASKKRGRPTRSSEPKAPPPSADPSSAPAEPPAEGKKKKKVRQPSSTYSLSSKGAASDDIRAQLEGLTVPKLRGKVRYLGADKSRIGRCLEKRDLISLALELLRNTRRKASGSSSKESARSPRTID
mmetsp:Transcript_64166/g.150599  ORF Transcript_64166/g.150599 Transcript_64166/m.150599 type:complete len:257 (-) Transcript_64166:111-881(-)